MRPKNIRRPSPGIAIHGYRASDEQSFVLRSKTNNLNSQLGDLVVSLTEGLLEGADMRKKKNQQLKVKLERVKSLLNELGVNY